MKTDLFKESIEKAVNLIKKSNKIIILTGAGISTPSGIPDFRSPETGLWEKNNPFAVASLTAFRYHPEAFFNWLHPLAKQILEAQPNEAHKALAHLEGAGIVQAIITQNIDNLHQKAGSKNVIEVHGSANHFICLNCHQTFPLDQFIKPFIAQKRFPYCPNCDHVLKPDIVLYEEMLPADAWAAAEWYSQTADLMIVVGSSLETIPVANLPYVALQSGAKLIINTISTTYLDSYADVLLPYDVIKVLPNLAAEVL